MAAKKKIEERSARVLDLLQQIDSVNEMISFHRKVTSETLMAEQYEFQKSKFVKELQIALSAFQVEIDIRKVAIAA